MTGRRADWSGCWTAMVTPFTQDAAAVDHARLRERVAEQAAAGVAGIVPCGTTGESPTLSSEEHRAVIETALSAARPLKLRVMAGAGSNDTARAVTLHRMVAAMGADAALHVAPYYNKPSQEGLYQHFMRVADAAELPVVLYSIPGRCGVAIQPDTVERLAAHPNIVAIKEATGSVESAMEIRRRCALPILSGDDALTIAFAAVGAVGVVSVISNLAPAAVRDLVAACRANDLDRARALHEALLPLSKAMLALDTNPVPVKAALRLLGRDSGEVRLPLVKASSTTQKAIEELLRRAGVTGERRADAPRELAR
jgi:4-hydroxy-tetrahydrodipicolinate synthase